MPRRNPEAALAVEGKCARCAGSTCCTYVTQRISAPRSKADFDHLLWQVAHAGVEAFQDGSGWYLLMRGHCEHLRAGGGCGIYAARPQVCRDYANDWCELDEPASRHFSHHFRDHAELLAYCRKRFRRWP
ncbi:MAG: YkgJ family cysteine cluster protein [Gammaproteobacteria bacterium]|jgi:Fe-S-cluster containining protein|nr:YkgJ family cysteine cluster protein [Gammaproteobacteria bacterium]